jgi:hypothetical protein
MNNVDHAKIVETDGYGNLIAGTVPPPVTLCETYRLCIECPCYRKCLNEVRR